MSSRAVTPRAVWVRRNLFKTPWDTAATVVFGLLALYLVYQAVVFVFVNARWEIIERNLKLLMVGRWPVDEMYAISIALAVTSLVIGLVAGYVYSRQVARGTSVVATMSPRARALDLLRRFGVLVASVLLLLALTSTPGPWVTAGAMAVAAIAGVAAGRVLGASPRRRLAGRTLVGVVVLAPPALFFYLNSVVPLEDWEGFMFNIAAAIAGISLCFPLGVLLALGRRSRLKLVKSLSVLYIELVRGSPLYVLLLLANVSLEFFVPASMAPSKVVRAIVTFTLFTAAYLAEIVRGGLQSVPRGQEEAAKSLGLSPTKQMRLIVLPQALRNVIPAQIGQFISLFKDTTLAGLALGIFDLLAGAQAITAQPDFRGQGLIIETLVFVGFLFWVGSFTMSRESQRLERRLGVGTR